MELVIYVDGTPDDWFQDNYGERFHTVALLCATDISRLNRQIQRYADKVPGGLRQWKKIGGNSRRKRPFLDAFISTWDALDSWVNVVSFEERAVAESADFLCKRFGEHGIGFEATQDGDWRHGFCNIDGYHELKDKPKKLLPLLFLAWLIGDLLAFYCNRLRLNYPGEQINISVCLNHLSGDGLSFTGLDMLRRLLAYAEIHTDTLSLNESRQLLMADNLAGVFNLCRINREWSAILGRVDVPKPFTWMRFCGVSGGQPVWEPFT